MDKWYKLHVDYDSHGRQIPQYYDGYGITYFGDRLFAYAGTVDGDWFIVKVRAPEEVHLALQEKEDVEVLTEEQVTALLNAKFGKSLSFSEWDQRFCIG